MQALDGSEGPSTVPGPSALLRWALGTTSLRMHWLKEATQRHRPSEEHKGLEDQNGYEMFVGLSVCLSIHPSIH